MPAIPAVAYVRMSSSKQDKSPEQQREEIERHAAARGYTIIRWYTDEGISGWKHARPGFQRLVADAARGEFELVLCWDQDRFSRFDPLDFFHYVRELRNAGVGIETIAQGRLDFDSIGGLLTSTVNQHGKAQYVRDLARGITRGQANAAKRGGPTGAKPPYGYRKVGGRLVLGPPEEVAVVRGIFTAYATRDVSPGGIARDLNARGVPASHGGPWLKSSILHLLANETYTGDYAWPRTTQAKFFQVGPDGSPVAVTAAENVGKKLRRATPLVFRPDDHPAIVDRKTWDKVQRKLVDRSREHQPYKNNPHPLASILRCGHCGGAMVAYKKRYYICSKYAQAACKHYTVLESEILPFAVKLLFQEVEEARLRELEPTPPQPADHAASVATLEGRLADLAHKGLRIEDAAIEAPKGQKATFFARLEAIQAERAEVERHLREARQQKPYPSVSQMMCDHQQWWWSVQDSLYSILPGVHPAQSWCVAEFNPLGIEPLYLHGDTLRQLFLDVGCRITLLWESVPKSAPSKWLHRVASGTFQIGHRSGEVSHFGPHRTSSRTSRPGRRHSGRGAPRASSAAWASPIRAAAGGRR